MGRLTSWIATAFVVMALAAAAARPPAPAQATGSSPQARTVEVRIVESDGFRWADAAVGALAVVGLLLAIGGATVVIRAGIGFHDGRTRGGTR